MHPRCPAARAAHDAAVARADAALAAAEARHLNARRSGCPLAEFAAWNVRARAQQAADAAREAAAEAADPERFHRDRLHDAALAAEAYYYPAA